MYGNTKEIMLQSSYGEIIIRVFIHHNYDCLFIPKISFSANAHYFKSCFLLFRANFHAYCLFSLVNTIVYCIPAGWLWNSNGFLKQLGVVDIAGSGGVHLVGGSSGRPESLRKNA